MTKHGDDLATEAAAKPGGVRRWLVRRSLLWPLALVVLLSLVSVAMADVWSGQSSATSQQLNGVSCASASDCVTVGASGTIETTGDSGATWSTQTSGTTSDLQAVSCPSASACFAVGASGTTLGTTDGGASWSSVSAGITGTLYGVSCADASDCVAVGAGGAIVATTDGGANWSAQTSGTTDKLNGIACASSSDCIAAGDGGTIVATTDGGATWSAQTSGTTEQLNGVACPSSSNCVAAGDGGTVLTTTDGGSSWTSQTSGTTDDLDGVSCVTTSSCWTAGDNGVILKTTDGGASWAAQTSGTTDRLRGLSCVTGHCWAVGDNGTIVNAVAPANTTAPTVTGTERVGDTLTAHNGSWSGSLPIGYSYQWQSCDPAGGSCTDIDGATNDTYVLDGGDVGSVVSVSVTATNAEGADVAAVATDVIDPATGPSCTDSWMPTTGAWETASNWSTASVPTSSDVVCMRKGSAPTVHDDDQRAATVHGGRAAIDVSSGYLELTGSSGHSQLGTLTLDGGDLINYGSLSIETALDWATGTLGGSGSTILTESATSDIAPDATPITLDSQELVNEGDLTLTCAQGDDPTGTFSVLQGTDDASLVNDATMTIDVPGGSSTAVGCQLRRADGTDPTFENHGDVSETAGSGVGAVQVGWKYANSHDATVTDAQIALFGGQTGDIDGRWNSSTLQLSAGSGYTFADGSSFGDDNSTGSAIVVDASPSSQGSGYTDFTQWLAGNADAPSLHAGAVSWPWGWILANGPVTIGTEGAEATIGAANVYNTTLTSPGSLTVSNGLNTTGATVTTAGPLTVDYGYNADNTTSSTGPLTVTYGLTISESTFETSGNTTVTYGLAAFDSTLTSGAEMSVTYGLLASNSTVTSDGAMSVTYGVAAFDARLTSDGGMSVTSGLIADATVISSPDAIEVTDGIIAENRTKFTGGGTVAIPVGSDNDSTFSDVVLDNETVASEANLTVTGTLIGVNGARIENVGTIDADASAFMPAPGADPPTLDNYGALIDSATTINRNLVVWPMGVTSGSVQADTYQIGYPAPTQFGGGSPAAPYQQPSKCGDPVMCATGDQTESQTDLVVGGLGGLALTRSYNSQLAASQLSPGAFGYGWTSSFEAHLWINTDRGLATVQQANGSTAGFTIDGSGDFVPDAGVEATLTADGSGGYVYTLPSQLKLAFDGDGVLQSQTDRVGRTTTFDYNGSGQLTTITAPSGREITLTYNPSGQVATATDPAGLTVSYGYDDNGNLTEVDDSDGPATTPWQFGYDDQHQLTSMTDANGNTTTIAYAGGQVVSQTDALNRTRTWDYSPGQTLVTSPAGNVTQYLFDENGLPLSTTVGYGTADASTTTFEYDTAGRPTAITDGNGHTTTYEYDSGGNKTSETTPNSHTTSWTYDSDRDVTSKTLPSGTSTSYDYDSHGLPTSITTTGSGSLSETSTATYTSNGQLETRTDALGKTRSYAYDSFGDLASVTDPLGNETTFGHDDNGRVLWNVSPAGNATGGNPLDHTSSYSYDALGDLTSSTDANGHTTSYSYDPNQNLLSSTDANDHTTTRTYNAANQLIETDLGDSTTQTSAYDYDGNLIAQVDGNGHETTYTYTPLGQLATSTDPLSRTTSHEYDAAGNPTTVTDAAGRVTTNTYNDDNQLTSVSYDDGVTPGVSYSYDDDGLPTSMTDGTGTISYDYDGLDRLTSTTNGNGQTVSYDYNDGDQITSIGYPNSHTVIQTYDDAGRVATVTDWLSNTTTFDYGPDSTLATTTFPSASDNTDTNNYDHADQLTGTTTAQGSTSLAELAYTRDPIGLITNASQTGLPGAASIDYGYTQTNQLASANTTNYGYDQANNLTELDGQTGYSYDQASQLTASPTATYDYDDLGQRVQQTPSSGPSTDYEYDQAGRLTGVTGGPASLDVSYGYDGAGNLATRTAGTDSREFAWSAGGLPLMLTDGHTSYLYGPDGLAFEQITSAGTVSYLHHDQIGSTRLITDDTGTTAGTITYDPYGAVSATTGTATSDLGYAGQFTDPDTSLQYDRARFYDPTTGQFINRDPIEAVTQQPYAYAGNSPINASDPTGLILGIPGTPSWGDVGGAIVSAGGAAVDALAHSPLLPVKYYLDEIRAYQSGCGYLASVKHGLIGAAVAAADATGIAAVARGAAGLAAEGTADVAAGLGTKLPVPEIPVGITRSQFGSDVLRWGTGDAAARARIASLSRDELQAAGVTRQMAEDWATFYRNEVLRNPNNPSAAGRADLMDAAARLLP